MPAAHAQLCGVNAHGHQHPRIGARHALLSRMLSVSGQVSRPFSAISFLSCPGCPPNCGDRAGLGRICRLRFYEIFMANICLAGIAVVMRILKIEAADIPEIMRILALPDANATPFDQPGALEP